MPQAKAEPISDTIRVVKRLQATCATEGCWKTIYAYTEDGENLSSPWYHDDTSRTPCVVRTERRGRHAASEVTPRV